MRVLLTSGRVLALTAAVALTFVAGCTTTPPAGPGDTDTEPETSAGPTDAAQPSDPAVRPSCAVAPASLVKETLGLDAQGPAQTSADTSIECTYPVGAMNVIVHFETGQDASSFADHRHASDATGEPTSDVPGVGDEGFSSSVEFGDTVTNTVVVRKGAVEIKVVAAASIDKEKALIGRLFTAIG